MKVSRIRPKNGKPASGQALPARVRLRGLLPASDRGRLSRPGQRSAAFAWELGRRWRMGQGPRPCWRVGPGRRPGFDTLPAPPYSGPELPFRREVTKAVGVLSSQQIRALLGAPTPLVSEFADVDDQLQANGFDLTLGSIGAFRTAGSIGPHDDRVLADTTELPFDEHGLVKLAPGPYLVRLNEVVSLPSNVMAIARPRSSLLRSGAAVHNAVWDAGYSGRSQVLVVVYNPHGLELARGARIVQMVFMTLDTATDSPYAGLFQHEALAPVEQPPRAT